MMASVYATLLLAFILDLSGLRRSAVTCLFLSLVLCLWLWVRARAAEECESDCGTFGAAEPWAEANT